MNMSSADVFVAGVGRTPFGRFPGRSLSDLAHDAVDVCLRDAGAKRGNVEQIFFANTGQGALEGQHMVRGEVALRALGFNSIPIVNVENACASAATAFKLAVTAVRAGEADVALAIGAEKLVSDYPDKAIAFFEGAMDVTRGLATLAALEALSPPPFRPEGRRSVFMDIYAAIGRRYMDRFGATQGQFAAVTAKNRVHASHNVNAQYRIELTASEITAARSIIWPLTLPMCAPTGDGAAAALVCSARGLAKLGAAARAVRVRAALLATGTPRAFDDDASHISRRLSQRAYECAGIGPSDISLAEVHDATAVGEVIQTECLGFCPIGDGASAAERGETRLGGRIPVNLSGGLQCNGHPVGATGLAQIHELVTQLRGEAGLRQADAPRFGLAENGGGWIEVEEAVAAITILERPAR